MAGDGDCISFARGLSIPIVEAQQEPHNIRGGNCESIQHIIADGHSRRGTPSEGPHFDEFLEPSLALSKISESEIFTHSSSRKKASYSDVSSD